MNHIHRFTALLAAVLVTACNIILPTAGPAPHYQQVILTDSTSSLKP